jgi:hypothetical protein
VCKGLGLEKRALNVHSKTSQEKSWNVHLKTLMIELKRNKMKENSFKEHFHM